MTQLHRCIVEYDGTALAGFQRQPGKDTVQGALESALNKVTGGCTRVVGAGRTDAGVHALGQVIHFSVDTTLDTARLQDAVNACLPRTVRIRKLVLADASFHARYSAISREYRYLVDNASAPSAFLVQRAHHVRPALDVPQMDAAAAALRGRHDFGAFGAPMIHSVEQGQASGAVDIKGSTERTMFLARCWRQSRFVHFRFIADAFLRHMVRMLVGTLIRIGSGSLPKSVIAKLLSGDRSIDAGPSAPAHGLYLVRVRY